MKAANMLNKLPEELLLEIIEYCEEIRSDLYHNPGIKYERVPILKSLCLVNKRLNRLATPRLYSEVSTRDGLDSRIHQFLLTIVRNRSLAKHVRTLYLEWCSSADESIDFGPTIYDEDGYVDQNFWIKLFGDYPSLHDTKTQAQLQAEARARALESYPPETVSEFEEFYQAALEIGLDRKKFECVKEGSESAMALILLAILPELRHVEIELPHSSGLFEDVQYLLKTKLPRKLESIRLDYQDMWREEPTREGYSMETLVPFLLLPSLRTVDASQICHDARPKRWITQYFGRSSVEEIILSLAIIDPQILAAILKIPRSLKKLTFQNGDEEYNTRMEFSQALSCVSHTLEYLAINFETSGYDDHTQIGSLCHFKALKTLSIAFDDILPQPSRSSHTTIPQTSSFTAHSTNSGFPNTNRLADVLPASLENLILDESFRNRWEAADYVEVVRQLLQDKYTSKKILPKLKLIGRGRDRRELWGRLGLGCLVGFAKEVGVMIGKAILCSDEDYIVEEVEEKEDWVCEQDEEEGEEEAEAEE